MLDITGVKPGRFEVAFDDHTPLDLRAVDASRVSKVVSLSCEGRSLVTLGAAADGGLVYLTLVSFAGEPERSSSRLAELPFETGLPCLDLASLGFSEGYETMSRTASLSVARAEDGFDLILKPATPDRALDAGAVRFLLAGRRLVGAAVRDLSAKRVERVCDTIRWTGGAS